MTIESISFSSTSGLAFCSSSILRATSAATTVSLAPLAREMAKATTGQPFSAANVRGSAMASVTVPSWSRRTLRPLGSAIMVAARSSTVCLPASVRMACSRPPISPRPPARSTLVARSWRLTSPAVMPKASSRSGSSAMRISRSTPPMRSICETPFTPCSARMTVSSTNQDSCSCVMPGARAA